MFNRLPKHVHMLSSCSVDGFKSQLDNYLRSIADLPCHPRFNNSLDGGDCINRGHIFPHIQPSTMPENFQAV